MYQTRQMLSSPKWTCHLCIILLLETWSTADMPFPWPFMRHFAYLMWFIVVAQISDRSMTLTLIVQFQQPVHHRHSWDWMIKHGVVWKYASVLCIINVQIDLGINVTEYKMFYYYVCFLDSFQSNGYIPQTYVYFPQGPSDIFMNVTIVIYHCLFKFFSSNYIKNKKNEKIVEKRKGKIRN